MTDEEKAEEENNVGIIFKKSYEELEKENAELKELTKGCTAIEINGVTFHSMQEMLVYMNNLRKENAELKAFCKKLIKTNNELRNSLRKYEIVPDVDYLPDGTEVYKENVGSNPYGSE